MKTKTIIVIFCLALVASLAEAKRLHLEKEYQQVWCDARGGEMEVVLEDRSRVDCLLPDYAVEADFASKWAEAIGQALLYAEATDRAPGILLIMEKDKDARYLARLLVAIAEVSPAITVWIITPEDLE